MSGYVTGLLDPYRLLILLTGAGIALLWRRRCVPVRRLLPATVSLVVLALLSTPIIANFCLGTLEWRYPPAESRPADAGAIVVLGGSMRPADPPRLHAELGEETLVRCMHAVEVYRRGPACPVVVCGGRISPGASTPPLAHLMRDFIRDHGVADEDIIVEESSLTTHENAIECRKLLGERGITGVVLVTDAAHMFRALRSFRKQGIAAVPSACHHDATEFDWSAWDFLPSAGAVRRHQRVFHEWIGLAWYWVRGYL
jgi:uncharacterized SAM-binding protein YcdF (DUF218 family)